MTLEEISIYLKDNTANKEKIDPQYIHLYKYAILEHAINKKDGCLLYNLVNFIANNYSNGNDKDILSTSLIVSSAYGYDNIIDTIVHHSSDYKETYHYCLCLAIKNEQYDCFKKLLDKTSSTYTYHSFGPALALVEDYEDEKLILHKWLDNDYISYALTSKNISFLRYIFEKEKDFKEQKTFEQLLKKQSIKTYARSSIEIMDYFLTSFFKDKHSFQKINVIKELTNVLLYMKDSENKINYLINHHGKKILPKSIDFERLIKEDNVSSLVLLNNHHIKFYRHQPAIFLHNSLSNKIYKKSWLFTSCQFSNQIETVQYILQNDSKFKFINKINKFLNISSHILPIKMTRITNQEMNEALRVASRRNKNENIINYLIENGADVQYALYGAIENQNFELVRFLIEEKNAKVTNVNELEKYLNVSMASDIKRYLNSVEMYYQLNLDFEQKNKNSIKDSTQPKKHKL